MKFDVQKSRLTLAAAILLLIPVLAFALPEGENVVAGSATFDRSQANALNVNTPSDKLIVNYNSFNIAQTEAVRFQQPSASSIVLNRVVGVDPSSIMGTLSANGRVFLVNPNGVIFGPNSRVDVAGLVASSLNISNDDFINGNYVFSKNGKNGYVINQGNINVQKGGYVCLLGGAVDNSLAIQADLGTVVLASGEKMTLALEDQNAISVVVDEAVQSEVFGPDGSKMTSAVKNSGSILAEGGKVILTAKVLNRVFDYAINNSGLVKVSSLVNHDGIIELMAEGAPVVNSGTLEADHVYIGSDAELINTKDGKIIANAVNAASPDGGKVFIQAATILQQGMISANALEQGTAGEIIIVSEGTTTLDESSCTEARAMGIVGNGGRISIDSKNGSVFVNKNAKIDFSAGSLAGNGGILKVDAFAQLGFYGILNGRAPPGFQPGIALLDPEYATIGTPEGTTLIEADTTIDAWLDITINGNITIGFNNTLNLYADTIAVTYEGGNYTEYSWDTTNNPGIGAIISAGDYMISGDDGGGTLNLRAGSGIGSIDRMIWTNVRTLSAVINPNSTEGDILIEQDFTELEIADIRSPGLVVIISSGRIMSGAEGTSIRADELYIESAGGIGAYYGDGIYSWVDISVNNLAVWNEGSGDIFIRNDKDLTVLAAVNTAYDGAIDIEAEGTLRVRYGISSGNNITLYAQNDIIISTLADLIAWGEGSSIYLTSENGAITSINMEVLDYGMRAYWNFDQSYSYYYAQDVSGNGYSAYCSGNPQIVEGVYGQALSFNGTTDYINIGTNFGFGQGQFTLMCWYKGTQSLNNVGLVGASPGTTGYALETHYGQLQSWVNNSMNRSDITINDGNWYQLAMVREGAEGSLYIFNNEDVKYATDFATSSGSVDTASNFWIGGWGQMKRLTQGSLDDVRVYASALSGLEIYGQTLVAPGAGVISAGEVVLSAANGIDVAMNGVGTVTATNSVSGDINITNIGDLYVGSAGSYVDGIYNHGGNIYLSVMSNLDILNDIRADAQGASISLYADDDIFLDNQVSISAGPDTHYESFASVIAGDVILSAGGNITFNYGAGVSSYASSSGFATGYAQAGNVSLLAGGAISLDWANISSNAIAYGLQSAEAYSGSVIIDAGGLLTINQGSQIFSNADATTGAGGTSAYADSGAVSLTGDDGLTVDGTGVGYGADIYSYANARSYLIAQSYSSTISLLAPYGNVSLGNVEVRSYANANASAGVQGSNIDAIAGDYNLAVLIDAGGSITFTTGGEAYGRAVAQNAADAYALSGDISLDAGNGITLADRYLRSEASTDADSYAESISGKLTLNTSSGAVSVPTAIQSSATAHVRTNGASAYATSDDILVRSLSGAMDLTSSISSMAETYGNSEIVPALLWGISGDVTVYAGTGLTMTAGDVNSWAYTTSGNASSLILTSGNIDVYSGGTLTASNSSIYSEAGDGEGTSAVAGTLTAGNIAIETVGDATLTNTGIYSSADISSVDGVGDVNAYSGAVDLAIGGTLSLTNSDVFTYAAAVGRVVNAIARGTLEDEYYDPYYGWIYETVLKGVRIEAGSDITVTESYIYSRAYADSAGWDASATSGDVDVDSFGDIYVSTDTGGPVVYSQALAQGGDVNTETWGNLSVRADGDIELNNSIMGGEITLIADWDENGLGSFILPAGAVLTLTGNRHYLQAANDFALSEGLTDAGYLLTLWGGDMYAQVNLVSATGAADPSALTVISTAGSIDVNSSMSRNDFIVLSGADGLYIFGVIEAGYLQLYSGAEFYSGEWLYADSSILVRATGDVEFTGGDGIGMTAGTDIDIISTEGSITANGSLYSEEGSISLTSAGSLSIYETLDAAGYIRLLAGAGYDEEEGYFVTNYEANLIIDATCTAGTFLEMAAGGITEMNAATAGTYIDLYSNGDVQINGGLIAGTDLNIETGGAFLSGSLTATTGDVDVNAGGSVTVNGAVSANNYVHLISGGAMTLQDVSAGFGLDITTETGDLTATSLTVDEGYIDVEAGGSMTVAGAISASDYVDVYAEGGTMDLGGVTAGGDIYAYSLDDMTISGDLEAEGYIELESDNDLFVFANMNAPSIDLQTAGNLYGDGDVILYAQNHSFSAAGDFFINDGEYEYEDTVSSGNFFAILNGNDQPLGSLTVYSTDGSVTVSGALERGDYGFIQLYGHSGVILNAPITMGLGSSLYIFSFNGSILAGELDGAHIISAGNVYLYDGSTVYSGQPPDYQLIPSETMIGSEEFPLDVLITGEGSLSLDCYGAIGGVSGWLTGTIREITTPEAVTVNNAPGLVYFNGVAVGAEPEHEHHDAEPEPAPAPVGSIISNQPNAVDAANLAVFQFNSPIGSVFFYHPITSAEMGSLDQFALGADAYTLRDGQLQLVGHDGLLEFFQEFDKRKPSL
jgi:filamentous hemagglutinin family protein